MPSGTINKIIAVLRVLRMTINAQIIYNSFRKELREDIYSLEQKYFCKKRLIKRQKKYILFHLIYCQLISSFSRNKLDKNQIKRIIYFSSIAPVLDDLQDEQGIFIEYADLILLLEGKSHPKLSELENRLASKYLTGSLKNLRPKVVDHLILTAVQFLKVNHPSADNKSHKGALTALMYRQLMGGLPDGEEAELIMKSGHLGQFIDDIFDYFEDRASNQTSLATAHKQVSFLKTAWFKEKEQFLRALAVYLEKKEQNKPISYYSFAFLLHLPYVAIQQYEKFTDKNGEMKRQLSRKSYICDMEKPANQLRWLHSFMVSKI